MNSRLKKYLRTDNALEAHKDKILGFDRKTTLIYKGNDNKPVLSTLQAGRWTSGVESDEEAVGRLDSESESEEEKPDLLGITNLVRIDEDGDLVIAAPQTQTGTHLRLGAKPGAIEMVSDTLKQDIMNSKNAAPIKRNKAGQIVAPGQDIKTLNQEKLKSWSSGVKQISQIKELQEREESEKSKPFIRREIEADVDMELQARRRYGDPLEKFDKPKKTQKIEASAYSFTNRFGIPPGRKWDGVDRSNGFEATWMGRNDLNTRKGLTNALD
mmetsp:Transcript_27256/g.48972  ORF Transcript_27256/g.48972 Transcript_27256/m.48972 type:complete len:270 (+) Transcript_27256:6-815(+)